MRHLDYRDFPEGTGAPARSRAQKWVFLIPGLAGPGLAPPGWPPGSGRSGPMDLGPAWSGSPAVSFWNGADGVAQAAAADGTGAMMANAPGEEAAGALDELARGIWESHAPGVLDIWRLRAAGSELGIEDWVSTDRIFVGEHLAPQGEPKPWGGLMRRRPQKLCELWILKGSGMFCGPAAQPQPFSEGDAVVRIGGSWSKIARWAWERDYELLARD